MKNYIIIGAVILVLAVSIFQSYQISSLKETKTTTKTNNLDMGGWTEDEKMMYEHHGTLPARLQSGVQSQATGMVGGC